MKKNLDVCLVFISAAMMFVVACNGACNTLRDSGGRIAEGFVDCMTPSAQEAIGAFLPAMGDVVRNALDDSGRVDWEPVKAAGKSLKTPAQQCVMAAAIAEMMRPREVKDGAPRSSPLEVDSEALLVGWQQMRGELFGGARYKLADIEL